MNEISEERVWDQILPPLSAAGRGWNCQRNFVEHKVWRKPIFPEKTPIRLTLRSHLLSINTVHPPKIETGSFSWLLWYVRRTILVGAQLKFGV